jgi:hypothetical protein
MIRLNNNHQISNIIKVLLFLAQEFFGFEHKRRSKTKFPNLSTNFWTVLFNPKVGWPLNWLSVKTNGFDAYLLKFLTCWAKSTHANHKYSCWFWNVGIGMTKNWRCWFLHFRILTSLFCLVFFSKHTLA